MNVPPHSCAVKPFSSIKFHQNCIKCHLRDRKRPQDLLPGSTRGAPTILSTQRPSSLSSRPSARWDGSFCHVMRTDPTTSYFKCHPEGGTTEGSFPLHGKDSSAPPQNDTILFQKDPTICRWGRMSTSPPPPVIIPVNNRKAAFS